MDHEEPVRVYTTYDLSEADVLRIALEEEGIVAQLENEHQAGLAHVLPIGILVRESDADRAREILQRLEQLPRDEEDHSDE
jgi:hypothetical protein